MSNTDRDSATPKPRVDRGLLEKDVSWLGKRLREPSTYAGLGAVVALTGAQLDPGIIHAVAEIGGGLGALIAIFLPEA